MSVTKKKTTVRKKTTRKKKNAIEEIGTVLTPSKTRRLAGRPSKYDPAFCEIVIECMSKGFSKEAVAGHLFVCRDTIYEWEKKHPEFFDTIKLGVELSRLFWEGKGVDTLLYTQKSGKRIEATTWIFNMKNRFGWKDKQEVEIGNKGDETFKFAFDLSDKPEG